MEISTHMALNLTLLKNVSHANNIHTCCRHESRTMSRKFFSFRERSTFKMFLKIVQGLFLC